MPTTKRTTNPRAITLALSLAKQIVAILDPVDARETRLEPRLRRPSKRAKKQVKR